MLEKYVFWNNRYHRLIIDNQKNFQYQLINRPSPNFHHFCPFPCILFNCMTVFFSEMSHDKYLTDCMTVEFHNPPPTTCRNFICYSRSAYNLLFVIDNAPVTVFPQGRLFLIS